MRQSVTLRSGAEEHRVAVADGTVTVDGVEVTPPRHAYAVADGGTRWVFLRGEVYELEVAQEGRRRASAHLGSLSAPMPATVVRINTQPGAEVRKGDTLLVLEAMKMELPIRAGADGVVTAGLCRGGERVQPGLPLVEGK
jgi:biotin carboxyl carrier protein